MNDHKNLQVVFVTGNIKPQKDSARMDDYNAGLLTASMQLAFIPTKLKSYDITYGKICGPVEQAMNTT